MWAGDEVLISHLEHHSNIVPLDMLCGEKGAHLKVIPVNDAVRTWTPSAAAERAHQDCCGYPCLHALGTITPIKEIIRIAHAAGVPVLLDGAQAIPHMPVNVYELGCDFYAFSLTRRRPHGAGRALRQGAPPRCHAPLAGRGRHDHVGHL